MKKTEVLLVLISIVFVSCSRGYQQFMSSYSFKATDNMPDYSNLDYWAAHPYKKDPSDSLPKKLRKNFKADSAADVFFIYPTSYSDPDYSLGYNAPIDNAEINAKTDYKSILYQASIFNAAGRVFAPRYRQANYWCYFPKDTAAAKAAFEFAYLDVKAAFEYYLTHYNNGRPIIIAAHSQGTTHALTLLKEFFDDKLLGKQLIVAYLVGMPVRPGYFSHIKSCDTPDETGCFCSWRTLETGYVTEYIKNENYKAIVTNPLTWTDSIPAATRKDNPGSVLRNFSKIKPYVTNAVVHEGVLWADKPKFFGNIFLRTRNYHIADYNFFYLSVRNNVRRRVDAFLKTYDK
ncbi:MAG: DUF3089 domain-containing protein [Bacteroidetes bacterium]|nr:DUF3089 domain-containing protein [Bacteroidota bacterium]